MKKGDQVKHHSGRLATLVGNPRVGGLSFVVIFDGTHSPQSRARSEFSLPDGSPIPEIKKVETSKFAAPTNGESDLPPAPRGRERATHTYAPGSGPVTLEQLEQTVGECWIHLQRLEDAVALLRVRTMIQGELARLVDGSPPDYSAIQADIQRLASSIEAAFAGVAPTNKSR